MFNLQSFKCILYQSMRGGGAGAESVGGMILRRDPKTGQFAGCGEREINWVIDRLANASLPK